jgi:hypothetical protein
MRFGLLQRMRRSELRFLNGEDCIMGFAQSRANGLRFVADDQRNTIGR